MPQRRNRTPVMVQCQARPGGTTLIAYGFNSGADAGDRSTLGQQDVSAGVAGATVAFGVNRPKPARVAKRKTTGTESSFVAFSSEADAKAAGFRVVTPRRFAVPKKTSKQTLVYVKTSNLKYAWMMDSADFAAFGGELGIKEVTTTDEVVVGASAPKPASVFTVIAGTSGNPDRTTGSFYEDGTTLDPKWSPRSAAKPPLF